MRADYTYYANGLVQKVSFGNGAEIEYFYDDANRLTRMIHRDEPGAVDPLMDQEYIYNSRDLVVQINSSYGFGDGDTYYLYDMRGRLKF